MSENSADNLKNNPKLPGTFKQFITRFPELGDAHESVAAAAETVGPLDKKPACSSKSASASAPDWSRH